MEANRIHKGGNGSEEQESNGSEGSSSQGSSGSSKSSGSSGSSSTSGSSSESGGNKSKEISNTKENTKFELKNNVVLMGQSQEVDWDLIKSNTEMLYHAWPTLVLDLHELNVKNEDILNFSNVLDQVTVSVKQEDKVATLNNLASLYAFLPNYRSQISEDNQSINMDYVKGCVLNSYALLEQGKWDEMQAQLTNATNYFANIMNRVEERNQNQSQISRIYVLLNELNNSINKKQKELFYIKYRNLMEELMNFKG